MHEEMPSCPLRKTRKLFAVSTRISATEHFSSHYFEDGLVLYTTYTRRQTLKNANKDIAILPPILECSSSWPVVVAEPPTATREEAAPPRHVLRAPCELLLNQNRDGLGGILTAKRTDGGTHYAFFERLLHLKIGPASRGAVQKNARKKGEKEGRQMKEKRIKKTH